MLVSVVQSGAVVTRSNLSQIYTQHCTDSSRTEFILEKHNRHQFLALTGEIWVVCCENLKKIDRVMAVPHCFNPFPVAFGTLLWVSLSYDATSVLMQSSLRTSESDVLCLYVLLCLVVTKKCKYGEIKLCGKKIIGINYQQDRELSNYPLELCIYITFIFMMGLRRVHPWYQKIRYMNTIHGVPGVMVV